MANHKVYTSFRYYPRYIRCDIDISDITIHRESQVIQLPHSTIVNCTLERFSQGLNAGPTNNVVLELDPIVAHAQQFSRNRLYLVAVHPFYNEPRTPEMEVMVSVINAFRSGTVPDTPTNPYEREFIRAGKSAEYAPSEWDSTVRPDAYTPIPSPLVRILKELPMLIIIWVLVTIAIGLIAEFFLH